MVSNIGLTSKFEVQTSNHLFPLMNLYNMNNAFLDAKNKSVVIRLNRFIS